MGKEKDHQLLKTSRSSQHKTVGKMSRFLLSLLVLLPILNICKYDCFVQGSSKVGCDKNLLKLLEKIHLSQSTKSVNRFQNVCSIHKVEVYTLRIKHSVVYQPQAAYLSVSNLISECMLG